MVDYYELLEIQRDADAKTVKASYRKLALAYHPDRNPGDRVAEEKFKAINEAYAVLSDPDKRGRYDRYGRVDEGIPMGSDIFDIFASVFGGGVAGMGARARGRGFAGEDLEVELTVTLEQARAGETVAVNVQRYATCAHCHGERAEPGSNGKQTCPTCRGAGQVRGQAQSLFGTVITSRPCPDCRGEGQLISEPCSVCDGQGRQLAVEEVDVGLPRGIDAGYRLRVPHAGNAGIEGGPAGDLYVYIDMAPHPVFRRDGDDLHYELELGLAQATLGAVFTIPTMDGDEELRVPAGTQPMAEFRLRAKGMPRLRQPGSGDEVVTARVMVPERLPSEARDLLAAYAVEVGEEIEEHESVVERVKGLFGRIRDRLGRDEDGADPASHKPAN
ncbi:MAG TPA: molecular chaperone DnaJ [Trueperaceae bacterium]|nr:molecular chaperone DnaJ [Trueperaceae bacterium]